MTRGLLALAGDASEVAAVMAHEIGHVTSHHSALRAEREREAAIISKAAEVIQNKQKGEEIRSSQRMSVASFSRQQELDADAIGVRVIARAGYDPYGASRFLTALGKSSDLRAALYSKKKSSMEFILFQRIPQTPIAWRGRSRRRVDRSPGIGRRDREGYLEAIRSGVGDDPAEGYVRGRKFTHPRLGFPSTRPRALFSRTRRRRFLGYKNAKTRRCGSTACARRCLNRLKATWRRDGSTACCNPRSGAPTSMAYRR